MPFNFGDIPLILQELRRYFASKAQGTLADSALQPGAIGSTVQAYHARLDSLSGITNADGGIEKTGANTYGRYALTAFGKSLVDDADASTARSTLGLTIGSNVQAWDADLDALAAISTNGPIERTGLGAWAVSDRVRLFGGNGGNNGATDYSSTNGDTLGQGVYYYRNFTVAVGHVITVDKFARIYCSGAVVINGRIIVTQASYGGVPGNFSLNGVQGGIVGFGVGCQQPLSAGDKYGAAGTKYPWTLQPFGTGGTSGYGTSTSPSTSDYTAGGGGNGGGGLIIEAVGAIAITLGSGGSSITANGTNGANGTISLGTASATGGGGGSGGVVVLSSLTSITFNANGQSFAAITANGGNGGTGVTTISGGSAGGAGGGAGGWVVLTAPTIAYSGTPTPTITVNGGSGSNFVGVAGSPGGGFGGACAGNGGANGSGNASAGQSGQIIQRTWREVA